MGISVCPTLVVYQSPSPPYCPSFILPMCPSSHWYVASVCTNVKVSGEVALAIQLLPQRQHIKMTAIAKWYQRIQSRHSCLMCLIIILSYYWATTDCQKLNRIEVRMYVRLIVICDPQQKTTKLNQQDIRNLLHHWFWSHFTTASVIHVGIGLLHSNAICTLIHINTCMIKLFNSFSNGKKISQLSHSV